MSEISVDAAISFFKNIPANAGKPYVLAFSTKTSSSDIAQDAGKFSTQLVQDINNRYGSDLDTDSVNIDEFTRMASGDKYSTYNGITDNAKKALVHATFNEISGNRSTATASDIGEYLRVRDYKDGETNGQAVINFLI